MVERFSAGGPKVAFDIGQGLTDGTLPPEVMTTIHRVLQESLTNVRRHAPGTGWVEADLRLTDGSDMRACVPKACAVNGRRAPWPADRLAITATVRLRVRHPRLDGRHQVLARWGAGSAWWAWPSASRRSAAASPPRPVPPGAWEVTAGELRSGELLVVDQEGQQVLAGEQADGLAVVEDDRGVGLLQRLDGVGDRLARADIGSGWDMCLSSGSSGRPAAVRARRADRVPGSSRPPRRPSPAAPPSSPESARRRTRA